LPLAKANGYFSVKSAINKEAQTRNITNVVGEPCLFGFAIRKWLLLGFLIRLY